MRPQTRIDIPVQAQRANRVRHPKRRMTKRAWLVAIPFFVFFLLVSGIAGSLRDTAVFYLHVARLYTQTPESRIAMPLKDIRKQQIADTWGAPRGTNRTHEGQDIFAAKGTPILSATSG